MARGAERIVVQAGALRLRTAPRLNGGFLVFLPLSTRIATVRVTIDGKAHGPRSARSQPPKQARASAASVPVGDVAPGRLADGRYAPGYVQYRIKTDKLAVIVDDPAGGLPWVLRQFDADRVVVDTPARSLAKARRIGRSRCVQLGRLRGATVGWIYGDGQFRKAGTEYPLLQCTPLKRQAPVGQLVSTLAVADPAAPAITGSVVWGYIPGAQDATVSGAGSADGAAKVNDGAFLRLGGVDARPDVASVRGGGKTVRFGPRRAAVGDHAPPALPDPDRRHRGARGARARPGRRVRTWRCGWRSPRRACRARSALRRSSATGRAASTCGSGSSPAAG